MPIMRRLLDHSRMPRVPPFVFSAPVIEFVDHACEKGGCFGVEWCGSVGEELRLNL